MSRNDELVAVVTGGSRGIGKGVARALAERGATVYIAGRSQAGGILPLISNKNGSRIERLAESS